jgi:signal transduction histidine kinase
MRLAICFFGFSLILSKYWPKHFKSLWKYYWILGLTFSLPFFFTFMLLMNQGSTMWHVNEIVGILVLTLFVNWPLFFLCIFLSVSSSLAAYFFNTGNLIISADVLAVVPTYISSLIFFILLMNNKNKIDIEKIELVKSLSYIIAHELRTPLATMQNCHYVLERDIKDEYKTDGIRKTLSLIDTTLSNTNLFIDILLRKTKNFDYLAKTNIKLKDTIDVSIKNYPSTNKDIITNNVDNAYIVYADPSLITHIMYNLIQNALTSIKQKGKGLIYINSYHSDKYIYITFKDTGLGISKRNKNKIFTSFFTDTRYGTGLGLYFCKTAMETIGGNISCKSVEGEYTEFTLKFPKVSSKD